MDIQYKTNVIPSIDQLINLFNDSEYFPIEDKSDRLRIVRMFAKANIVVSAWHGELLVGISRSLCDFEYCCYLSDLCVRNNYKGKQIGKQLVLITKETAGDKCKLILQSSPNALGFYSQIGMERIDSAFIFSRKY
jgi:GNAT superfamily N-acetyltransferase